MAAMLRFGCCRALTENKTRVCGYRSNNLWRNATTDFNNLAKSAKTSATGWQPALKL